MNNKKSYHQFMEEMGAAMVSSAATGETATSTIANRTGSAVSTDIPVVKPKKIKKPPVVRRSLPINVGKSNG